MMLRSLIKSAAARAISWTPLNEMTRVHLHRHVPFVLSYHRVVERLNASDGFALPAMEISTAMLERHLDWVGQHFRIVSLDDLETELEKMDGARPLAAVTFDDGYRDIYHHAFPLLKRKGIPAGIFVITGLVGSAEPPVHEKLHALLVGASRRRTSIPDSLTDPLQEAGVKFSVQEHARKVVDPFSATRFLLEHLTQAEVKRVIDGLEIMIDIGDNWKRELLPLSWDMLVEMRDAGMTIGSHTASHPFLSNEREGQVLEETSSSRQELERRLGVEVRCFAYPGGSFNPAVVRAVATAGYRYAFTICRHRDAQYPLLTIPRKRLWEQSCLDYRGRFSPAIMSCQTATTFRRASRCTQAHAA